jgi:hypothetical protein
MTFIRKEPLTLFLAIVFSLLSISLFAVTYRGGRWMQYNLLDYIEKYFYLGISLISRPITYFLQIQKERPEQPKERKKYPIMPILRGVLIAIPVVLFFTALLSSADVVFNQKLIDLFEQITFRTFFDNLYRLFIILFWAYLLAGVFLHAAAKSQDEKLDYEKKSIIKPFLGFTEAAIVLGSLIALFSVFVGIQFQYFFGGKVNIGVEGFTYSQYARRGFNELLMVAFFSLLMIVVLSISTKRESQIQKRVYSGFSVALAGLVLIILVSSYQRLMLAIDWHGFSRLRLYPRVFLIWVGLLFIAVVLLETFRQERFFTFAALLASLGFAVSLSLVNVDASIVRHNLWRATQGKHLNVQHLASLSTDAVPALVDEFSNPALSTATREGVGAAALCYTQTMQDIPMGNWRYFNYSHWKAAQALAEIQDDLAGYRLNVKKTPARVRAPSNKLYECPSDSFFD